MQAMDSYYGLESSWEYHSTYLDVDIQASVDRYGRYIYRAYYDDAWHIVRKLDRMQVFIGLYLNPDGWQFIDEYWEYMIWRYVPTQKYSHNLIYPAEDSYDTLQECRTAINEFVEAELIASEPKPEPEPKLPTTLTIDVHPMSGVSPYGVSITVELISDGDLLPQKPVQLYKNDVPISTRNTDLGGRVEFSDTVSDEASYYAYFAGDSEYEGCEPMLKRMM